MSERDEAWAYVPYSGGSHAWLLEPWCARICGYGDEGDGGYPCGVEAQGHVWLGVDLHTGVRLYTFACGRHASRLLNARGAIVDAHELGADCGMPGSEWIQGDPSSCRGASFESWLMTDERDVPDILVVA